MLDARQRSLVRNTQSLGPVNGDGEGNAPNLLATGVLDGDLVVTGQIALARPRPIWRGAVLGGVPGILDPWIRRPIRTDRTGFVLAAWAEPGALELDHAALWRAAFDLDGRDGEALRLDRCRAGGWAGWRRRG